MSGKRKTIVASIFLGIFVFLLIFYMLFTVQYIDTVFANQDFGHDTVVEQSGLSKSTSIFFINTNKARAQIEAAFPYAKVNYVSRRFPNRVAISISEREELYYVAESPLGPYVVLCDELKVLDREDEQMFVNKFDRNNNILLEGVSTAGLQAGQFADALLTVYFTKCLSGFWITPQDSEKEFVPKEHIQKLVVDNFDVTIYLKNNATIKFERAHEYLPLKIGVFIYLYFHENLVDQNNDKVEIAGQNILITMKNGVPTPVWLSNN